MIEFFYWYAAIGAVFLAILLSIEDNREAFRCRPLKVQLLLVFVMLFAYPIVLAAVIRDEASR